MKTLLIVMTTALLVIAGSNDVVAQATIETNNPTFGAFLGWNGAQNLDFRTNNSRRMRIMLQQTLNINGGTINTGGNTAFGSVDANTIALAKIHIFDNGASTNTTGYRQWMNAGQLFSIDRADMFVGAVKLPSNGEHCAIINFTRGDNQPLGTLRFITTDGNGSGSGRFSQDGLEVARMTDSGFTGIGVGWSNASQPIRTLDVLGNEDFPQFRITKTQAGLQGSGLFADFQAHSDGNLFIKPLDFDNVRTTVIGALPGDITNPVLTAPYMALDVFGETRIRLVRDAIEPDCVMLGNKSVSSDNFDQIIRKVNLPHDENMFLNGLGEFSIPIDKDWEYDGTNVWTGHGLNGYPTGNVAIGLTGTNADAKLHVKSTLTNYPAASPFFASTAIVAESEPTNSPIAIGVLLSVKDGISGDYGTYTSLDGTNANLKVGHQVLFANSALSSIGYRSSATGGTQTNVGGSFISSGTTTSVCYGIFAQATGGTNNYGAYAGAPTTTGSAAAYINGNATITGSFIPGSDINLKTEIQPINEASSLLFSLQPKSYFFSSDVPNLNLSERKQFGLIAQEVEEVMPWLVHDLVRPASYDSLGNMTVEPFHYKGISYLDFIALLIAGFQEQNGLVAGQAGIIQNQATQLNAQAATIAELESKVASMEQKMESMFTVMQSMQAKTNNCCNDGNTGTIQAPASTNDGVKLMQNIPNPFETHTRIDFTLPADAYVVLELSDAQGRPLRKLVDGQMNAGPQSIVLDGSFLAPGSYFYTVYANGQMITKKMIKR